MLIDVLGRGATATVYRAFDYQLRVFRAVKLVDPTLPDGPRLRHRLGQEAQLMARLAHPNVVTLFELGDDDGQIFLVMELIAGGSVHERLMAQGPLPPRMAVSVALGLLSALAYAHDNGVVHRDVKPHNILIDVDGTPKVTDFGIARWEDGSMTRTGALLGTMAYMPPEQKTSARKVDPRSDLYAAGCTLYAMLTATEPHDLFAAGLDPGVAREQLGALPSSLADFIRRSASFRAEDRFATAQEMSAALAEAAEALPPDPPSAALVDQALVSRAKSFATVGPTLLDATSSDIATEIDTSREATPDSGDSSIDVGVPAPRSLAQLAVRSIVPVEIKPRALPPASPKRSWAPLLAAALMLSLAAAVGYGSWLRWQHTSMQPTQPSRIASGTPKAPSVEPLSIELLLPPESPLELSVPPAPSAEISRPRPRPHDQDLRVAAVSPSSEPAAEPIMQAPKPSGQRWKMITLPDGRSSERMATLEAEANVLDSDGTSGRPTIVLRCNRSGFQGLLMSGIGHLATSPLDVGSQLVSIDIDIDGEHLRKTFATSTDEPGRIEFRADKKLIPQILRANTVSFRYESFLGAAVTATFHPRSPDVLLDLEPCL